MLKLTYKKLEDIPEEYQKLYKEDNGVYKLQLDDKVVPKSKLDEFRQTNVDLMKKIGDIESKLDGVSIDEIKNLSAKLKDKRIKDLIDKGDIDTVIKEKTDSIVSDYEAKLKSLNTKLSDYEELTKAYKSKIGKVIIDNNIQNAVTKLASVKPGAMTDITNRAKQVWTIDDEGNPVPKDPATGEVIYKEGKPITFDDWAETLLHDAPYFFEASSGSGAHHQTISNKVNMETLREKALEGDSSLISKLAKGDIVVD